MSLFHEMLFDVNEIELMSGNKREFIRKLSSSNRLNLLLINMKNIILLCLVVIYLCIEIG